MLEARTRGDNPWWPPMQQIADWLKELGMSEYAQRFAENDIDIAVLPDLTDQHLRDLGVSLGHRLKMLRSIAELDDTPAAAGPAPTQASAPPPTAAPPAHASAERRHLTVMFCDLVEFDRHRGTARR